MTEYRDCEVSGFIFTKQDSCLAICRINFHASLWHETLRKLFKSFLNFLPGTVYPLKNFTDIKYSTHLPYAFASLCHFFHWQSVFVVLGLGYRWRCVEYNKFIEHNWWATSSSGCWWAQQAWACRVLERCERNKIEKINTPCAVLEMVGKIGHLFVTMEKLTKCRTKSQELCEKEHRNTHVSIIIVSSRSNSRGGRYWIVCYFQQKHFLFLVHCGTQRVI